MVEGWIANYYILADLLYCAFEGLLTLTVSEEKNWEGLWTWLVRVQLQSTHRYDRISFGLWSTPFFLQTSFPKCNFVALLLWSGIFSCFSYHCFNYRYFFVILSSCRMPSERWKELYRSPRNSLTTQVTVNNHKYSLVLSCRS